MSTREKSAPREAYLCEESPSLIQNWPAARVVLDTYTLDTEL